MAQGWESVELEVFRAHSSSFIEAITEITPVANRLHEKSLIDKHTYNKVTEKATGLSQLDKATEVVKVLEKTVSVLKDDKKRKEKFAQILDIFGEFIPLSYIADDAREACESIKRKRRNPPKDVAPPDGHAATTTTTPKPFSGDPLSREPEIDQIVEWIVPHVASRWKIFGTMLRVPEGTLGAIEEDNIHRCQKAAIEMFSTWKRLKCSPCTWRNLLDVLRSQVIGERKLAETTTEKVLNTY